jgi:hypothetical protein
MVSLKVAFAHLAEDVVLAGLQALDLGKLDQATSGAAPRQHRDDVDRRGDQRPRNGDDDFLDELFEPVQRANRIAGVECNN